MNNTLILNPPILIRIKELQFGLILKVFWILSFAFFAALLAFYIFQVNAVISETFQFKNYKKTINELLTENKILEINSIQINSLENLEDKIEKLGFEKTNKIYYIQVLENKIALKHEKQLED